MRKTTEELVNECVSELKDSQFDFNDLDAVDKQMLFQWFETFRRLVIENERECAEPFGTVWDVLDDFIITKAGLSPDLPVYIGFPPAAQAPEVKCWYCGKTTADQHNPNECKAMLAAAPEVKHAE